MEPTRKSTHHNRSDSRSCYDGTNDNGCGKHAGVIRTRNSDATLTLVIGVVTRVFSEEFQVGGLIFRLIFRKETR